MTDKEAIEILKDLWRYKDSKFSEKEIREALDKGIESLENQKNIIKELEQIRAEIDALDKWGQTFYRYNLALGDCIEIIDNHITEIKGEKE